MLSDHQFYRLKRELTDTYPGAVYAGRPLLLEGGLDWKAMSLTPKDMDFLDAKNSAAREIALAFGVPPMLLGIPGDNTYANFRSQPRFGSRPCCRWRRVGGAIALAVAAVRRGPAHRGYDRIDALASDAAVDRIANAVPDAEREAATAGTC